MYPPIHDHIQEIKDAISAEENQKAKRRAMFQIAGSILALFIDQITGISIGSIGYTVGTGVAVAYQGIKSSKTFKSILRQVHPHPEQIESQIEESEPVINIRQFFEQAQISYLSEMQKQTLMLKPKTPQSLTVTSGFPSHLLARWNAPVTATGSVYGFIDKDLQDAKNDLRDRQEKQDLESRRKELADDIFNNIRIAVALDDSIIAPDLDSENPNIKELFDEHNLKTIILKMGKKEFDVILKNALGLVFDISRISIYTLHKIKTQIGKTFPTFFNIQNRIELMILRSTSLTQTDYLLSALSAFLDFIDILGTEAKVSFLFYELFNRYSSQKLTSTRILSLLGQESGCIISSKTVQHVTKKLINLFLLSHNDVHQYGIKANELELIKNEAYEIMLGKFIEDGKVDPIFGPAKFDVLFRVLLVINYEKGRGRPLKNLAEVVSFEDLGKIPRKYRDKLVTYRSGFTETLRFSGFMHPDKLTALKEILDNLIPIGCESLIHQEALLSLDGYKDSMVEFTLSKSRPKKSSSGKHTFDPLVMYPYLRGFAKKMWQQYLHLYLFRKELRSDPYITFHKSTFDTNLISEAIFGERKDYSSGSKGDWTRNRIPRKIELLIKQAGMIPYYDLRNEVQYRKISDWIPQHHIDYNKESTDSLDLILLASMHSVLGWLEPLKPPEYSQVMHEFRNDFEAIRPFRGWNPHLKSIYNQRAREIVRSWRDSKSKEIPLLGITEEWIGDAERSYTKTYKVWLLNGRIVGDVNSLTPNQLKDAEYRILSIYQIIDYIIDHMAFKLGI